MRSRTPRAVRLAAASALLLVLAGATPVAAAVIDGRLDPGSPAPIVVQTTQTSFRDADGIEGPYLSDGSELDAAHATIEDGVLHLFIAGNVGFCCGHEFQHQESLHLFFDSIEGGQSVLRADNPRVWPLAGLRFDEGFAADRWISLTLRANTEYAELPAGGGGADYFLGWSPTGPTGVLTGGTNPFGIQAAIDASNLAGVTHGCDAASGADATAGIELAIPLAALGDPTGCVKVTALIAYSGGPFVGNQVLGPLPVGSCALGAAPDFGAIPGDQSFTVCPNTVPAHASTWGRLKVRYR